MGKFTNALSRIGRGFKNVVTSETTRKIVSNVGNVAMRALESEVGQKVVAGVVQGIAEASISDVDTGAAVKRAVIGNVLGIHDPPIDPLNPGEQLLANRIREINGEMKAIESFDRHSAAVQRKLNTSIEKLNKVVKNTAEATLEEEDQVGNLDVAMRSMLEITEHETKNLQMLHEALGKEARLRNREENKLIEAMKLNYQAMANTVKAEKDAIMEEAIEQIVDIGGEIAEHLAAEAPLVGESIAAGMATARGVQQMYKLNKTISRISGVPVPHIELPAISPVAVDTLFNSEAINESTLQKVINSKLRHIEEIKKEVVHLNEVLNTELKKKSVEENRKVGVPENTVHHVVRSQFHVPRTKRPGVHIYTAPYDSEYILILLFVSPYSIHRSFMVCVDLAIDFVYYNDIAHGGTRVHKGPKGASGMLNFRNGCKDFFKESASHAGSTRMHSERLLRSAGGEPMYITSMQYPYSFVQTRKHAEVFCKNPEVQKHILRGPLNMQRTSVLNAIFHGVTLVSMAKSRSVQQGTRVQRPRS
ncbi:outer capsid protein VP5 [Guangxi orbivirus]|uniref:outer capsid protein VP5 n=1 Tax=Guangxi orbivirus TaxID=2306813 RepID=UPI000E9E8F1B|nr:outer capsid protein VP5 [Guangxi orbivirus]AXS78003.1 outer capsid protein VP5 [Guangxi orbivirus]BCL59295.1 VP5 [Guangxi orbivirus]